MFLFPAATSSSVPPDEESADGIAEKKKLRTDLIWNFAAFALTGACGFLLNVLIGVLYDASALGVFNQVFAFYIFGSQFAVLGVHYSVLQQLAARSREADKHAAIVVAAMGLALFFGVLTAGAVFAARGWIGIVLDSPDVGAGVAWMAPGLLFFALNKVLMNALNGLRRMRLFAIFQAGRVIVMTVSLLILAFLRVHQSVLPSILSIAEILIFAILFPVSIRHWWGGHLGWMKWLKPHLVFGFRSSMSGVLVELNTRVDVIMLGGFVSDRLVGLYSLAALTAEGCFQILIVIRNNYNPILAKLLAEHDFEAIHSLATRSKIRIYCAYALLGTVAVLGFPILNWVVNRDGEPLSNWLAFTFLMVGIVVSSGYIPFNNILLQSGFPGTHTIMMVFVVLINVILNFACIPFWGINGAAAATGLSFAASVLILIFSSRLTIGVRL